MKNTFADTYYFLALMNPKDRAHQRAIDAAITLQGGLITTYWVMIELADAMSAPENRDEFLSTLDDLRSNPLVTILHPDIDQFEEGRVLFAARPDKHWSLTDCISFIVMKQHRLTEALTGDKHFEQAGFVALLR